MVEHSQSMFSGHSNRLWSIKNSFNINNGQLEESCIEIEKLDKKTGWFKEKYKTINPLEHQLRLTPSACSLF